MSSLFQSLVGKFNDNIVREILLASENVKISRTCMTIEDLEIFIPIADQHGLHVVLSASKYIHKRDIGKGGWSNDIERSVDIHHPDGQFNVYIGLNQEMIEKSMFFEESSKEDSFGQLLHIPPCCREAYIQRHSIAQQKQNDFVPLVLAGTLAPPPYNFWNNYVSQYFDRALLSFFPCSFNCPYAAEFAQATFHLLQHHSVSWAQQFIESQRANILYTEYEGLYRFSNTRYENGWLDYDYKLLQSTDETVLSSTLRRGNRLCILGKNGIAIYHNDQIITTIENNDISICLFQ